MFFAFIIILTIAWYCQSIRLCCCWWFCGLVWIYSIFLVLFATPLHLQTSAEIRAFLLRETRLIDVQPGRAAGCEAGQDLRAAPPSSWWSTTSHSCRCPNGLISAFTMSTPGWSSTSTCRSLSPQVSSASPSSEKKNTINLSFYHI